MAVSCSNQENGSGWFINMIRCMDLHRDQNMVHRIHWQMIFLQAVIRAKHGLRLTSILGPTRFFMYALSNEGYPGTLLSLQPNSGNLAGLVSGHHCSKWNATTIRNGVYNYNLQISSNDLNNPMTGVPMIVTVTGQKGTLTSKIGILDSKSVFISKDGDASIMLYNAGLSTLKKFKFNSDNKKFTLVSMPDSLNPGDSAQLTVRFTPTAAGLQLAKIKITTNDGSLNLSGTGIGVNASGNDINRCSDSDRCQSGFYRKKYFYHFQQDRKISIELFHAGNRRH